MRPDADVLPSEEVMAQVIQDKCEAALSFLFSEHEVSMSMQYKLIRDGYKNLGMVSRMAGSEEGVKKLMIDDFGVEDTKPGRLELTKMALVWSAARTSKDTDDKAKAEAKSHNFLRPVDDNELDLMRLAYIKTRGPLDKEYIPTLGFLQLKLDQIEKGFYRATPLYEVTTGDFDEGGDPKRQTDMYGYERFFKTRNRIAMPVDVEEFRFRIRAEGVSG